MEPTREQLQAEILEILYQKCLQKPIWVSCAEIFWSISNLKVSERSVKDVLDWLVKNDLVIYQADKYQIAKREFMDISRRKTRLDLVVEYSIYMGMSMIQMRGVMFLV